MSMTIEIEIQPFSTPNFVLQKMQPSPRQEGIKFAEGIPLRAVSESTLDKMCDQFRKDVFAKAGKTDPRLRARGA